MKSFVILSLVAAVAVVRAQSSSNSSASPLIPTNISTGCSSFLSALNSNSSLSSCVSSVVSATSAFGPLGNSSNVTSTGDINTTLNSLCSSSSACPDAVIRGQLASFYTACTDELTGSSPNTDVIRIYDVLYAIEPLTKAACTKDDSGRYCTAQISSGTSASNATGSSKSVSTSQQNAYQLVQNSLWQSFMPSTKRDDATNASALLPNMTTFRSENVLFLFFSPNMSSSALCVPCARNVLTAYINFEQNIEYALGIANSPMLGGLPELYSAATSICGSNFLSGAVQAAGGLEGGLISGAMPHATIESGVFSVAAAAIFGLAALL
ncbi:hypothetical protein EW145_g5958 [Phellinidium pouzarii]|uniref:DUF7729 domain-containing protein n=1 Tax=Phellinidium pouzarii TaxID=167371 RepID=A0A4S4L2Y7_9AGAM|nr:hypothetical protein EW145_g5958 [Phellinidium pouzarii]